LRGPPQSLARPPRPTENPQLLAVVEKLNFQYKAIPILLSVGLRGNQASQSHSQSHSRINRAVGRVNCVVGSIAQSDQSKLGQLCSQLNQPNLVDWRRCTYTVVVVQRWTQRRKDSPVFSTIPWRFGCPAVLHCPGGEGELRERLGRSTQKNSI